jgi:hypothetical protein
MLGREPPDRRCGIVSGHADHHALIVAGSGTVPDKSIESDTAAGQQGTLGEKVEDAHGRIMNEE